MEVYLCVPPLFPAPQLSPRGNDDSEFYTCHFPAFEKQYPHTYRCPNNTLWLLPTFMKRYHTVT